MKSHTLSAESTKLQFENPVPEELTEILSSFGLAGRSLRAELFEAPALPGGPGDVVFVTGESGGGKSSLLRAWGMPTRRSGVSDGTPLALLGGASPESVIKTIRLFSSCGLAEASLWGKPVSCLSDSQRARADVAFQILSGEDTVWVDEFLATLDRETAKPVAVGVARAIRRSGKRGVFATSHRDLLPFLRPDYAFDVSAWPPSISPMECLESAWESSPESAILGEVSTEDSQYYGRSPLRHLHYLGGVPGGVVSCFRQATKSGKDVGILVVTSKLGGGFCVSRVVVHPSYRGLGVAARLVRAAVAAYGSRGLSATAAMGVFSGFFERGGMVKVSEKRHGLPLAAERELTAACPRVPYLWSGRREDCVASPEALAWLVLNVRRVLHLIKPGGRRVSVEEARQKLTLEPFTASRVLWAIRPRRMATFRAPQSPTQFLQSDL